MTTLIIFSVSFLAIVVMIAHKSFEMRGKGALLANMRQKADAMLARHIVTLKNHSRIIEKGTVQAMFRVFLMSLHGAFTHGIDAIKERWNAFFRFIDQSAVLKNKGQVSYFLRDISRSKENI